MLSLRLNTSSIIFAVTTESAITFLVCSLVSPQDSHKSLTVPSYVCPLSSFSLNFMSISFASFSKPCDIASSSFSERILNMSSSIRSIVSIEILSEIQIASFLSFNSTMNFTAVFLFSRFSMIPHTMENSSGSPL